MTGLEVKLVFVLVLAVLVAAPIRCTTDHDVTQMMHRLQRLEAENHQLNSKLENRNTLQKRLEKNIDILQNELDTLTPISIEDIEDEESVASAMESSYISTGVFTRWGRTLCGLGLDRIYTGMMGRTHTTHTGGGVNQQCLPHNPDYVKYVDGEQSGSDGRALIYGAEYQGDPEAVFNQTNLPEGTTSFVSQNIPCAVCRVENQTSVLMIPARTDCPPDWNRQYWGYLMAQLYDTSGSSEYVCVDEAPEIVNGGGEDTYGTSMYLVEALCDDYTLPCPGYVNGWELACVVCTR